jgi:hypothetical protein
MARSEPTTAPPPAAKRLQRSTFSRAWPSLSKSRVMAGLQCHRKLWWQAHEPWADELVPDASLRAVFDQGSRVGALARDYVAGGVLVQFEPRRRRQALAHTAQLIAGDTTAIYEAAFEHDGVLAVVDILERLPTLGGATVERAWSLIEVKSTLEVKQAHLSDVAVQTLIARRSGCDVRRVELMHLNRDCRYPDLSDLFVREDVTDEVESLLGELAAEIDSQKRCLQNPLPLVAPGPHCRRPYTCPFQERCSPSGPAGVAGAAGGTVVVQPGLGDVLASLAKPLAYLDFETIFPAVPAFDGCGPYHQVPVQFSVHREDAAGAISHHHAWLAPSGRDPRPALAARLLQATEGAATVLAWYAPFEHKRILELAAAVPQLSEQLLQLAGRVVDLLTIVRDHVYHPEFHGSFGLKRVFPVLVEGGGYDDLRIGSGGSAMSLLEELLLRGEPAAGSQRRSLRRALHAYCKRDTLALVLIMRQLRELARAAL